jgi:hypothetical protein
MAKLNGLVVDEYGTKRWYKDDLLHRDGDLPAIEYANGDKEWWVEGKRHRDGGLPAVEWSNGQKQWWVNDKFIRNNYNPLT